MTTMPLADIERMCCFGEERPMMKRIRLTVEWDGACDEDTYLAVLAEEIEDGDPSGGTCVTERERLTHYGTTFAESFYPGPVVRFRRWFRREGEVIVMVALVALVTAFAIALWGE